MELCASAFAIRASADLKPAAARAASEGGASAIGRSCRVLLFPRSDAVVSARPPRAVIADACRSLLIARRTVFRKRDGRGIGVRSPDERRRQESWRDRPVQVRLR
jgi:hypothetical protein